MPTSFFVPHTISLGEHPIGRGGFADVWKGSMGDENNSPIHRKSVAVKVLRHYGAKPLDLLKVMRSFVPFLCIINLNFFMLGTLS